ncbi:hypothetical protein [Chenggangzhangella methanolivorans]|uniref:Uncharacterized protein n=1 Tax=Chenggangzhangella methanolivorans TaxID=1437009 RepID=A0A9E6UP75_9HYPH|nr:hypothetical protein [Chenggangzhangella methanolivorans]QZO01099.1 hypothetical protein K6K41_05865 [Chenggangzhangella methanolivorans]
MTGARALSPEGVAILEALIEGADSPLLSGSVFRALENTGLIRRQGDGWLLTDDGLRSLNEARERMASDPQIRHGIG